MLNFRDKLYMLIAQPNDILTSAAPNTFGVGEIVALNAKGEIVDATNIANEDRIRFAIKKKSTGEVFYTPFIYKDEVKAVYREAPSAYQPQIVTIGYDGVDATKALPTPVDGTTYAFQVFIKSEGAYWAKSGVYTGKTGDLACDMLDEMFQFIPVQNDWASTVWADIFRISADAGTTLQDAGLLDISASINKDSNVIVLGGTSTTALQAGDYVRIGTATTDPVYRVVDVYGNSVEIDGYWHRLDYTGAIQKIDKTANLGIMFHGPDLSLLDYDPYLEDYSRFYSNIGFEVVVENLPIPETVQDMSLGRGEWWMVMSNELRHNTEYGGAKKPKLDAQVLKVETCDTCSYVQYILDWRKTSHAYNFETIDGQNVEKGHIIMYVPDGKAVDTDASKGVKALLQAWLGITL